MLPPGSHLFIDLKRGDRSSEGSGSTSASLSWLRAILRLGERTRLVKTSQRLSLCASLCHIVWRTGSVWQDLIILESVYLLPLSHIGYWFKVQHSLLSFRMVSIG